MNKAATNFPKLYDLAIVGGGINGCGIARDAAGRGLKVFLCEQGDLASATSSASTKLIHGGLRYLEHYEFRLVREALIERQVLLRAAPHIVRPLRFVLPHHQGLRPAWLLRLGLFIYDRLGGRGILPGTETVDLRRDRRGAPLSKEYTHAFEYSDCWVDDARLVVLNARDAAERGAIIQPRTRCIAARRESGHWVVDIEDVNSGSRTTVRAKVLVNAAGPWVTQVLDNAAGVRHDARLRLVKGSHVVVRRVFDGEHAYIFQNYDGRIAFAMPYEGRFTLIGTTDHAYEGDPGAVCIDPEETDYLLELVNGYFDKPVTLADVIWSYSGVRPLYDDCVANVSAVTRDYVFNVEGGRDKPPILSIFGGKITTYRKLAEHGLAKLAPFLPAMGSPWTASATLPGGDIPKADFGAFLSDVKARLPWLPDTLANRWARAYGTRLFVLCRDARSLDDLGPQVAPGLYEAELTYLVAQEWARTADDVLWRRTKLGLGMALHHKDAVAGWMENARTLARVPE